MKRKMLIKIGIAVTVLGLILICAGLAKKDPDPHMVDGPGMINEPNIVSFSYFHGASSLGDLYRITLEGQSFTVERCEGNGQPTFKKTYEISDDLYYSLSNIASNYNIASWVNLPDAEYFDLDAASTSVSISFRNGVTVNLSSDKKLPEPGWDAVNEMLFLFEAIMDK